MEPFLGWKSNKYYIFTVCVCSLRYSACNAHAPYYDCPTVQYFSTLSHKRHDFRGLGGGGWGGYWTQNMCLDLLYKFCLKHFSFYEELCEMLPLMYISHHVGVPVFVSSFNETWLFLRRFFEKSSNIKFHENPSSGSRVVPRGRTDGHDEAKYLFFRISRTRL